jgi:oxygen-independent coproporphyrinogen-3 oxidase
MAAPAGRTSAGQGVAFDPDLIRRYDVSGPRYTSYPTAVQFHTGFGPAQYRAAAAAVFEASTGPLSLYVHIPFCASPCFYCGCNKIITRDAAKAEQYLQYLYRELALQAPLFQRARRVEQLHLGGGTPTFLSLEQLEQLLAELSRRFSLTASGDREYSIEIDPRTLLPETLPSLAHMGFNRVSLGVQDFDPDVQRAVNRLQPAEQTLGAIAGARAAGFESVSVDLIYGLPKQTPASFARTLDTIIAARPDRLAVYGYAHMPRLFKPQRHINESELPSPATRIELLGLTVAKLTGAGYVYIGMDHFALPEDKLTQAQREGTLQRNFQGYSTHAGHELVALGVSSIGKLGDAYAQNAKSLNGYYAALDSGELTIQRGIALSADDKLRRAVIQQLMCHGAVDYAAIGTAFEIDFERYFAAELEQLARLEQDGLIELPDTGLRVTPAGRLLLRNVAMVFDAYLPKVAAAAFSKTI